MQAILVLYPYIFKACSTAFCGCVDPSKRHGTYIGMLMQSNPLKSHVPMLGGLFWWIACLPVRNELPRVVGGQFDKSLHQPTGRDVYVVEVPLLGMRKKIYNHLNRTCHKDALRRFKGFT